MPFLRQHDAAVITRQYPAHVRSMPYRTRAFKAVLNLDCSQRWTEATNYPPIPSYDTYYIPEEHVFFWKRGLQARLNAHQEKIQQFNTSRSARRTEIWYGLAVAIGHDFDWEARRDSYCIYVGGTCALVSGLHLRPAELE